MHLFYIFSLILFFLSTERRSESITTNVTTPGSIAGRFSVSPGGDAIYSIPMPVPPGTNGVQPQITLNYSSSGLNGVVGVGWSIGGLSAVTRGGQTKAIDGQQTNVNYSPDDRFFLDGEELIVSNGSYAYSTSEYITSTWKNRKIYSLGYLGSYNYSPEYFSVYNDGGSISEYGNSGNSRALGLLGAARVWGISKTMDSQGNYMTYLYDTINDNLRIKEIQYTANDSVSLMARRKVTFAYSTTTRQDIISKYQAGVKITTDYLLDSIKTWVQETSGTWNMVSALSMKYGFDKTIFKTILQSVDLCNANGTCFNETAFTNLSNATQPFADPTSISSPYQFTYGDFGTNANWGPQSTMPRKFADLNADGYTDVIGFKDGNVYYAINGMKQSGGGQWIPKIGPSFYTTAQGFSSQSKNPRLISDINSDGFPDIIGFSDASVYYSINDNGNGFNPKVPAGQFMAYSSGYLNQDQNQRLMADINYDGYPDIVAFGYFNVWAAFNQKGAGFSTPSEIIPGDFVGNSGWPTESEYPRFITDINRDGKPDIIGCKNNGVYYALNKNGSSFENAVCTSYDFFSTGSGFANTNDNPRMIIDMNNDGYPDIVGFADDAVYVSYNKGAYYAAGNAFEPQEVLIREFTKNAGGWLGNDIYPRFIQDLNADGYPDILGFKDNGVYYSLSENGKFSAPKYYGFYGSNTYPNNNDDPRMLMDMDGNGVPDIIAFKENMSGSFNQFTQANEIATITNGLGMQTNISYAPLTDSDVYTKGANVSFPQYNVVSPKFVVSQYTDTDGQQSYSNSFIYTHALTDFSHGWLGFADKQTSTTFSSSTNYYSQVYPTVGMIDSTRSYVQKRLVERMIHRNASSSGSYLKNFPNKVLPVATETISYDLQPGTSTNAIYNYRYDSMGYDANNNLTYEMVGYSQKPGQPLTSMYTKRGYQTLNFKKNGRGLSSYALNNEKASTSITTSLTAWDDTSDIAWEKLTYGANNLQQSSTIYVDGEWLGETMAYDAIGNMTTVCGNFEDTTTYKIDNVYMSFVTKETTPPNQFGKKLTKQFVTEPNFGKQLQLTDPNGNVFTTAIDGFGRSVASYGPNPTNKNQLVLLDTIVFGSNATGNFVQTFSRQDWDNTGPYSAWNMDRNSSDKFGRSVKNESTGWSTIVSERVFSDLFMDLIEKESFPYFEGQALIIPQWVIFTYALNGQMTAKTSNGLTTYYGNNKFDREKYEVVEGDTATNYYNDIGLLIKRKDPNGGITTFDHDVRGNIKSITDPNGVVNTTTFNNLGQAKTITNPDQGTTNFRLQKGRVVNVSTKGSGSSAINLSYTYDKMGRIIGQTRRWVTSGQNYVVLDTLFYDGKGGLGQLDSVKRLSKSPSGVYDPSGNFLEKYGYDAYGKLNLKKVYTFSMMQPVHLLTDQSAGDTLIENLSIKKQHLTFLYDYNAAGNLARSIFPDSSMVVNSYHSDNSLYNTSYYGKNSKAEQASITYKGYTALGQPGGVVYSNGLEELYQYDPKLGMVSNHLVQNSSGSGTILVDAEYKWNKHRYLDSLIDNGPDTTINATQYFTYDEMGSIQEAEAPGNTVIAHGKGHKVEGLYSYIKYAYNLGGDLMRKGGVNFTVGNGHQVTKGTVSGTRTSIFSATYDDTGNIASMTQPDASGLFQSAPVTSFTYLGNRQPQSVTVAGKSTSGSDLAVKTYWTYGYDGSRKSQVTGMLSKGTGSSTFNQWSQGNSLKIARYLTPDFQLQGVYNVSGTTGTMDSVYAHKYLMGPSGKKAMIKTALTTNDVFDYNLPTYTGSYTTPTIKPLEPQQPINQWEIPTFDGLLFSLLFFWMALIIWWLYITIVMSKKWSVLRWKIFRPHVAALLIVTTMMLYVVPINAIANAGVAKPGDTTYFFISSPVDHIQIVTDSKGDVFSKTYYTPYGSPVEKPSTALNTDSEQTGLSGKEYLSGMGLYFFGPRLYNPFIGRFVSPDTEIGTMSANDPMAFNRYAYGSNNPVNYIDPSGHFAFLAALASAVVGAIVSVAVTVVVAAVSNDWDHIGRDIAIGAATGFVGGLFGNPIQGAASAIAKSAAAGIGRKLAITGARTGAKAVLQRGLNTVAQKSSSGLINAAGTATVGAISSSLDYGLRVATGDEERNKNSIWTGALMGVAGGAAGKIFRNTGRAANKLGNSIGKKVQTTNIGKKLFPTNTKVVPHDIGKTGYQQNGTVNGRLERRYAEKMTLQETLEGPGRVLLSQRAKEGIALQAYQKGIFGEFAGGLLDTKSEAAITYGFSETAWYSDRFPQDLPKKP